MARRPASLLADTDIFIDYLNGVERMKAVDEKIAERFSDLLEKYARHGLRNADALVAATAWSRALPLLSRNIRHYRFISEITLLDPSKL